MLDELIRIFSVPRSIPLAFVLVAACCALLFRATARSIDSVDPGPGQNPPPPNPPPEPAQEPPTYAAKTVSCDVSFDELHQNEQAALRWWCSSYAEGDPRPKLTPTNIITEMEPTTGFVDLLPNSNGDKNLGALRECPRVWPYMRVQVPPREAKAIASRGLFSLMHPITSEITVFEAHFNIRDAYVRFDWTDPDWEDMRVPFGHIIRPHGDPNEDWRRLSPDGRRAWLNLAAYFYYGDALPDYEEERDKTDARDKALAALNRRLSDL